MYGGKADSLIRLRNLGIPVPDFFVVPASDYQTFLKENQLEDKIRSLLLEEKREEIEAVILAGKMSKELEQKISEEWNELHTSFVAVRSSALNEDGKTKSFAGQYTSYLNVSFANLFERIKLCWASFYNTSVAVYSDCEDLAAMNVIVQKMISATYSGVIFSVDPTSDTNHYSVLEVGEGCGEALVSGKITPTKYLIRRETKRSDLTLGTIKLSPDVIERLESLVLDIEREYQCFVDVEYAMKEDEIYILQARPITAFSPSRKSYQLSITRPHTLIEQELYYRGEYEGIKNLTDGLYYFRPLFLYNPNHGNVDVYYNMVDLEEDPRLIYRYLDFHYDSFSAYYDQVIKKDVQSLQIWMKEKNEFPLKDVLFCILHIYPFTSLGQLAGHYEQISGRLKQLLIEFRHQYDKVIHEACETLLDQIQKSLPRDYQEYFDVLLLDEIMTSLPNIEILKERKQGYIYFGTLFETKEYETWLQDHNIVIDTPKTGALQGSVCYGKQNVVGRVCLVYTEADFSKFKEGDILVTPMTVPKFMKVMKMASGIVTDEGGITCHAAIVARELKIPCIVGCKSATSVLKTGDIIELDVIHGQITIQTDG